MSERNYDINGTMNLVIVAGNVGKYINFDTKNGRSYCQFDIATQKAFRDKSGEKREITSWIKCVAFGPVAENISAHAKQGSKVLVRGELTSSLFEKGDVKVHTMSVNVSSFQFMSPLSKEEKQTVGEEQPEDGSAIDPKPDDGDDLPF